MKRLHYAAQLKRKMWTLKLKMWKHRIQYSVYQKPENAFYGFIMFGLFLAQVLLYMGTR
jgi:hypothetical protein